MNQSTLKDLLRYNPETGEFTWRQSRGPVRTGDKAGSLTSNGYTQIKVQWKFYYAHRLAFLYVIGEWPPVEVDHINGKRTDNRWGNLRAVTRLENNRNAKRRFDNTSGIPGVSWFKRDKKWYVRIYVEGTKKHVGVFTCLLDAVAARKRAEKEFGFHANHGRG